MIQSKKGAEKIISVYWFAILFLVAAAIVYMVSVFYGSPYDVRELEAKILVDKVIECFNKEGYINGNLNNENFLGECNLNLDVEDTNGWKDDQYYLEVNISGKIFFAGNANLKEFCSFKGKKLPVCIEESIYVTDAQSNDYQINVLSIIRKTEKNA